MLYRFGDFWINTDRIVSIIVDMHQSVGKYAVYATTQYSGAEIRYRISDDYDTYDQALKAAEDIVAKIEEAD